jgi:hypothetical protein
MILRYLTAYAFPILALFLLIGCQTNSRDQILATSESQVALREIQSRTFEVSDRNMMLRTVIATLQDLSFVIDKGDADLGTVSATKLDGYQLRMTVTVRRKSETQLLVRANAQYNITAIEDPEPYQQFFAALQKSVFLAEHTEKPVASTGLLAKEAKAESPTSSAGGTAAAAYESSVTTSMAESSAVSASAAASRASAAPFDGPWLLEIGEANAMHRRDIVRTVVTNGKFSAQFETNGWRGRLEGEINEYGLLVAKGTIDKGAGYMIGGAYYKGALQFTAPYQGDGFSQTIQSKARVSETFKVSLRRE